LNWRKAFTGILIIAISGFAFFLTATHFNISLFAAYNNITAIQTVSNKAEYPQSGSFSKTDRHKTSNFLFSKDIVFQDSSSFPDLKTATISFPENHADSYSSKALIYAVKLSTPSLNAINEYYKTAENKKTDDEITPDQLKIPHSFTSKEQDNLRDQFTVLIEEP